MNIFCLVDFTLSVVCICVRIEMEIDSSRIDNTGLQKKILNTKFSELS